MYVTGKNVRSWRIKFFIPLRVSNDNPYSESLFRTIKYCPWWPENGFRTIDEARSWLSRFMRWYNLEHKHSGIKYVTPGYNAIAGIDVQILEARKKVYREVCQRHPERWSKQLRDWELIQAVYLNQKKKRHNCNFITSGEH
ncbi:integrase core domain-containing protein [Escherichia coli]